MSRILIDMDREWKFHLGDIAEAEANSHSTSYSRCKAGAVVGAGGKHWNDREWRVVDLPHDYFSESDMREENLISHEISEEIKGSVFTEAVHAVYESMYSAITEGGELAESGAANLGIIESEINFEEKKRLQKGLSPQNVYFLRKLQRSCGIAELFKVCKKHRRYYGGYRSLQRAQRI